MDAHEAQLRGGGRCSDSARPGGGGRCGGATAGRDSVRRGGRLRAADERRPPAHRPAGEGRPGAAAGTTRSLQASGCKTVWATRIGRSLLGFVTYKYTQEKYFCWTSPRVTTVQVSAYPCCTDPTWFYRGTVGSAGWYFTWSGDSRGGHYSLRQGKFEQVLLGKVVNSALPWVKIWVYGNGGWSYATGA
jgi:hypothetical protein